MHQRTRLNCKYIRCGLDNIFYAAILTNNMKKCEKFHRMQHLEPHQTIFSEQTKNRYNVRYTHFEISVCLSTIQVFRNNFNYTT